MAELKFIFHCGFRLNMNRKSVLIDPYSKIKSTMWENTPDDIFESLILKPQTDILILSHAHDDHFNLDATLKIIERNPDIKIVTTKQITDILTSSGLRNADKILLPRKKVRGTEKTQIGDINITLFESEHDGPVEYRVEHIISLIQGERSVLYTGDAMPDVEEFERIAKCGKIDMLLAPFPYVTLHKTRSLVNKILKPEERVYAHMHKPEGDGILFKNATIECIKNERARGRKAVLMCEPDQTIIF